MPDLFRKDKISCLKVLQKMPSPKKNISHSESQVLYTLIYLAEHFLLDFPSALGKERFFNTLVRLLHKICH